ncbi:YtxH domain-containing protein [Actinoallomurus rhizosphaericola]|uniref:YtxH domain-containing protein n=1 Tax=Actinoallomurus rhizosphaericola TaxID=2952536 RepID=UPI002093B68A|nr:YtxH domain-containing protein [Actinoallomurus rhizosphaericola]MCO5996372.1 YtxH domain-containing protein [Actinoallomurus rhizosphaericola]
MKHRAVFLAGAATGYVLGTRAGKERYEQIKRMSRRVAENPRVQEAAGVLRAQAGEIAESARSRFGGKVQTMSEKVPGMRRGEPSATTGAADSTGQATPPGSTPADIT